MAPGRAALATGLAGALALTGAGSAGAVGAADRAAAVRATAWLATEPPASMPAGQQADVLVAMRITGRRPAALRPRLRALSKAAPAYATGAGEASKVVMGALAAGANPSRLGGVDYVARIRRDSPSPGRYGSTAFDQALSMLALRAATGRVPTTAARTLLGLRSGPGWNLGLTTAEGPDIDSTALAVVALRAAGQRCTAAPIRAARRWIARQRSGGGWSAYPGTGPSANSTALVARADLACGASASAPLRVIRRLQQRSGAIRYTAAEPESRLLATTESVPALAGVSLARGLRRD